MNRNSQLVATPDFGNSWKMLLGLDLELFGCRDEITSHPVNRTSSVRASMVTSVPWRPIFSCRCRVRSLPRGPWFTGWLDVGAGQAG